MKKRDYENLHPTIEAQMAMRIFHERYADQCGGSMDFWESLPESDKKYVIETILIAQGKKP